MKANYDISQFSPTLQVIFNAMKTYGIILADNGGPWYISGMPDSRWNNDILSGISLCTAMHSRWWMLHV